MCNAACVSPWADIIWNRRSTSHRHTLLQQRGAPIAAIDMELNVVRSELHALYETGRLQPSHGAAPTLQIA